MRWLGAIASALLFAACATSPLGRSQLMLVSDAQMDQMGVQAFEQLKAEQKVSTDPAQNRYVVCVARAILTALPAGQGQGAWEVRVFDDDSANAFALPGKKIGVHTGLLKVARNQHQLATVIGHEVAHVLGRHSGERVSAEMLKQGIAQGASTLVGAAGDPSSPLHGAAMQALGIGVNLGGLAYGRGHESEADEYGLRLMAEAGFDPRESVPLWRNMDAANQGQRPPEFLSTHPSPETRIADLSRQIPKELPKMQRARASGRNPRCG
ncbi:MAG: M48 family metallopeptidase [Myxococcota bacterium]